MSKILVCAATELELSFAFPELEDSILPQPGVLQHGHNFYAVTGIGLPHTIFHLTRLIQDIKPDLVLHVGICGAYPGSGLKIGEVVRVGREAFADIGVEDIDGRFISADDLEFSGDWVIDETPPEDVAKVAPELDPLYALPVVTGCSVNLSSGQDKTAKARSKKYEAQVESMEGAGVFFVCKELQVPAMEIRAVSNIAGNRDLDMWDKDLAVRKLGELLLPVIAEHD